MGHRPKRLHLTAHVKQGPPGTEYAVNDFLNIYLYNYPTEYAQARQHLQLGKDSKNEQSRNSGWYTKKTLDLQLQIHSDRIQQQTDRAIKIGDYMEIKTAYKQNNTIAIEDEPSYKQHHFHDYSVITTDIDMN
eukprot:3664446-Amphidinium_carterae.1